MKKVHILAVGKLRTPFWQAAAIYYQSRLKRGLVVSESVVKDSDAANLTERSRIEGVRLLAALLPEHYPICLDERGHQLDSVEFAYFVRRVHEQFGKTPCFILGGAYGLSPEVREATRDTLSLGKITLPHELARVVLLEQIYRAEQIFNNSPYHH